MNWNQTIIDRQSKSRNGLKKILVFFAVQLCCGIAFPQQINLQEAVNIALKNSLDIQVSKANVDIAHIYNDFGYAGGLPVITASGSDVESVSGVNQKINTGEVIKRDGATVNNLTANVTAGILLYNGSRVWATKKRLEELELQNRDHAQLANSEYHRIRDDCLL